MLRVQLYGQKLGVSNCFLNSSQNYHTRKEVKSKWQSCFPWIWSHLLLNLSWDHSHEITGNMFYGLYNFCLIESVWRESASFSLPLKILILSFWHELIKHCCKRSEFNQCRNRVSCLLALTLETCWQWQSFWWYFCDNSVHSEKWSGAWKSHLD